MATISANSPALKALGRTLKGAIHLPRDFGYDKLRTPWLDVVDQHPALIVDAACAEDVVAAVDFARTERLSFGVMSTGHGIAAPCDGLLLRFTKMNGVSVDESRRVATVAPGAVSSDLLKETEKHQLVYPAGQVGNVGVTGHALGGGIGWLVRKVGAAANSIVGADVVLADGSLVRADAEKNPDLFWALRGGGGNFGVVVSLEIALTPMADVIGGEMYFPLERAPELLRFYREWSSTLSSDTSTVFRLLAVPPAIMSPHEIRGKKVCMIGLCHTEPESRDAVLAPLDALGEPLRTDVKRRSFASLAGLDPASHSSGAPAYSQTEYLEALSDDAIDRLAGLAETMMPPLMQFEVQQLGGALASVSRDRGGAFEPPAAPYLVHLVTPAVKASMTEIASATSDAVTALGDVVTGKKIYNFLRGDEIRRVSDAFSAESFDRLHEIKRRYDPANFFHLNLNVTP